MSRLFLETLGTIKKARKRQGMSQEKAGLVIGCNQSQYGKKERGQQQFTVWEFCLLAEALQIVEEIKTLWIL